MRTTDAFRAPAAPGPSRSAWRAAAPVVVPSGVRRASAGEASSASVGPGVGHRFADVRVQAAAADALPVLQRCRACGGSAEGGECESCRRKRASLQRHAAEPAAPAPDAVAPPAVHAVLAQAGRPLDAGTRASMEAHFGHRFDAVRVHDDGAADASARAVRAHAYTVGAHVAFAAGRYAPNTADGQRLLAHELAHVVQQGPARAPAAGVPLAIDPSPEAERAAERASEQGAEHAGGSRLAVPNAPVSVQRSGGQDMCGGTGASATCATPNACVRPDPGKEGGLTPSTSWKLAVLIDTDRGSWYEALRTQEFGHTHVRFSEGSGREFTYGFYPAGALPNENRRTVPGCARHPDTSHDACVNDTVTFALTQAQYAAALVKAQAVCQAKGSYGQSYTCTTFAAEVATAAGQSLPSSKSAPIDVYYQQVPPIDNPNTLLENVKAERARSPSRRMPTWNTPPAPAAPSKAAPKPDREQVLDALAPPPDFARAFQVLNGSSMEAMLKILVAVNEQGKLPLLVRNTDLALGVDAGRIKVAVAAVERKGTAVIIGLTPFSVIQDDIEVAIALANLPADQKKVVERFLRSN